MIFSKGTRVKLVHTGDVGDVVGMLENGMVMVKIDGDFEIPVFAEDLANVDSFYTNKSSAKVIKTPDKPARPTTPPAPFTPKTQYEILTSQGIQVAFDPVLLDDGSVQKFVIYLLNDTAYDVVFNYEISFSSGRPQQTEGVLKSTSTQKTGEISYDQLNEAPQIFLEIWQITTAGKSEKQQKTLKIKAKQFFSKVATAPFLNRPVHLFKVFENFSAEENSTNEDLKNYTQRMVAPQKSRSSASKRFEIHDSKAYAEFIPEIDLHIEKLSDRHEKLSNGEIVRIQLAAFEKFMSKALHVGVNRVFIIHGVGEGRLRDEIATRLLKMPEVKSFKNEYHPRYGHGATEVEF